MKNNRQLQPIISEENEPLFQAWLYYKDRRGEHITTNAIFLKAYPGIFISIFNYV